MYEEIILDRSSLLDFHICSMSVWVVSKVALELWKFIGDGMRIVGVELSENLLVMWIRRQV